MPILLISLLPLIVLSLGNIAYKTYRAIKLNNTVQAQLNSVMFIIASGISVGLVYLSYNI